MDEGLAEEERDEEIHVDCDFKVMEGVCTDGAETVLGRFWKRTC